MTKKDNKEATILHVVDKVIRTMREPWYTQYAILLFPNGFLCIITDFPTYKPIRSTELQNRVEAYTGKKPWMYICNINFTHIFHIGDYKRYKLSVGFLTHENQNRPVARKINKDGGTITLDHLMTLYYEKQPKRRTDTKGN